MAKRILQIIILSILSLIILGSLLTLSISNSSYYTIGSSEKNKSSLVLIENEEKNDSPVLIYEDEAMPKKNNLEFEEKLKEEFDYYNEIEEFKDGVGLKECKRDADCTGEDYSENFCISNNVYREQYEYFCEKRECVTKPKRELVEVCENICQDGECFQNNMQENFKISYAPINNASYNQYETLFKNNEFLEEISYELNDMFTLPEDIEITLSECGEANALYDSENNNIKICYELIDELSSQISGVIETQEENEEVIILSSSLMIYHELGHALIDVLDIPVTENEEETVNQLSSLILIKSSRETAIIDLALWFFLKGNETNISNITFVDEHRLDEKNLYDLVCLVYGENTEDYSWLTDENIISPEMLTECELEYINISNNLNPQISSFINIQ